MKKREHGKFYVEYSDIKFIKDNKVIFTSSANKLSKLEIPNESMIYTFVEITDPELIVLLDSLDYIVDYYELLNTPKEQIEKLKSEKQSSYDYLDEKTDSLADFMNYTQIFANNIELLTYPHIINQYTRYLNSINDIKIIDKK